MSEQTTNLFAEDVKFTNVDTWVANGTPELFAAPYKQEIKFTKQLLHDLLRS